MRRWTVFAIALVLGVTMVAPAAQAADPLEDPIPEPILFGDVSVHLELVADGITAPLWATSAPGHPDHLYVVDQPGQLWAIDLTSGDKQVVADVSSLLVPLGAFGPGSFDERGFLGAAFHPDFAENGKLYTYTSQPVDGAADFSTMPAGETANHQTVITEWESDDPADPYAGFGSARELLRIDQPQFNHNAGALAFDHDGNLLIALGDGGGADDVDGQLFIGAPMVGHGDGNGQDPSNPLGAILRIDPRGSSSANGQYGIPTDNPFYAVDEYTSEIFAYGFRNPYRMSVDRDTGEIWTADVGQNDIEEVDIVENAGNYGWNLKEGSFFFDPNGNDPGFVTDEDPGGLPADLVDPVAEYDHDEGVAVVGGFVYRGGAIPELYGSYVFGEFARTFSNDGRLFYLSDEEIVELNLPLRANGFGMSLLGFGEDAAGELYALANLTGTPFGDTGKVLRIEPLPQADKFTAKLTGGQEVPPVATDGKGRAAFKVKDDGERLKFRLKVKNIDVEEIAAAHIHYGVPGENGPVVAFLYERNPSALPRGDALMVKGELTAADLIGPLAGDSLADLIGLLQSGKAYVNVHSDTYPSGEVRGLVVPKPAKFKAHLRGANEVPPVQSDASGKAKVKVGKKGNLRFKVKVAGITDVVQAHIHYGPPGANGPVVAFLFGPADPPVSIDDGRLAKGKITADDLLGPLAGMPIQALASAIQQGHAYVNVHTVANPSGELRGQLAWKG